MNPDQNASFVQGDTQFFDVSVVDENGDAVDLTDSSIEYQLTNDDTTLTKTRDDDVTVTDAVNGEFEVALLPADTSTLSRSYKHSVEVTDADGDVSTILSGTVYVTPDPN